MNSALNQLHTQVLHTMSVNKSERDNAASYF